MNALKSIANSLCMLCIMACCGAWLLFSHAATGWKAFIVPTGSMRPAILPGSVVLVHRVPVVSLRPGAIITYTNPLQPSETISHRIVRTYMLDGSVLSFITKGDANTATDVPVTNGSVIGKVVWHVPYLGSILLWARRPLGLLLAVYVPALLVMAEEARRLAAYFASMRPYRVAGWQQRRREQAGYDRLPKPLIAGTLAVLVGVSVGAAASRPALAQTNGDLAGQVRGSVIAADAVPPALQTTTD